MKTKFLRFALVLFCISVFSTIHPASNAHASQTNNFHFEDFSADYYLSRDQSGASHLRVVENLVAVFPNFAQNHGITRIIPFTNQAGTNLTMPSDSSLDLKAYRNKQPEPIAQIDAGDGYFTAYIGDEDNYQTGRQTYRLEYDFQDVIIDNIDNDDQVLYWDTNGNDWLQSFDQVSARVHLAPELAERLRPETYCFVGSFGEIGSERCLSSKSDDTLEFTAYDLTPGENLTFALEFQPDTFAPIPEKINPTLLPLAIFVGITTLLIVFLIFRTLSQTSAKRAYYRGLFTKSEYTPPRDLSVMESIFIYLHPNSLGNSRVATLLELAVQHKIQLIKTDSPKLRKPTWVIRILSTSLNAVETSILQILANSTDRLSVGQEITVKTHNPTRSIMQLNQNIPNLVRQKLLKKELLDPYAFHQKTQTNRGSKTLTVNTASFNLPNLLTIASILTLIAGGWLAITFFINLSRPYYVTPFAPLTTTLLAIFWLVPPIAGMVISAKAQPFLERTERGLETSKYLDGLKLYIKMAETDRIKFLQSVPGVETDPAGVVKLYEKLLPYAIMFNLEKTWLKNLAHYYDMNGVAEPNWYIGTGAFIASDFSKSLNSFTSDTAMSISHSTASGSSSSSGFSSGGGFSGGGGGGGGGGGW